MSVSFSSPRGKSSRSFRTRCGECEACLKEDCEKCVECVRKKKFGGDGSSKQACIFRRCTNLQDRRSSTSHSSSSSTNNQLPSKSAPAASTPATATTATIAPVAVAASMITTIDKTSSKAPPNSTSSSTSTRTRTRTRSCIAFRPPASLLEERSLKRARLSSSEDKTTTRTRTTTELPPVPIHMCGLPIPEDKVGVCGRCGKGGEDENETILLCDGEGCGKEFHMKCCIPSIQQVPDGAFYCFDCSPKGSTAQLEDYLQEHENRKYDLLDNNPDTNLVDTLLHEDTKEENPSAQSIEFPLSELDWIHRNEPECFIGKPIRLYCPHGNHYHNGRILDVRPCKTGTECQVRFPAGKDHRKISLTTWISLEEHCLAVATKTVWGKFRSKKEKSRSSKSSAKWLRAKLWSRTARELVPVMQLLNPKQGQIRYRKPFEHENNDNDHEEEEQTIKPQWGLVETFGTDRYELLNLPLETRDTPPKQQRQQQEREAEIMTALTNAEWEEQERVRKWKELPLLNPVHKAAIRCQDEYALGALEYKAQPKQYVRPSPLIPQGLDRTYLLSQISHRIGVPPTKDFASSLICELVESVPATIETITQYDRSMSNTEKSQATSSIL